MSSSIKTVGDRLILRRDLWRIAESGEVGQLQDLLAHGADVNASNGGGVTALMIAAHYGRLEMVRALTDHGADVNLMDRDGFTAAMLAQRSGHEDIVRTLVARGAKINPTRVAFGTASAPLETFDTFSDSKVASTGGNPLVRTLHEPHNIWEVVHETRQEFDPRSAFIGRLPPLGALGLPLIAVIAVGLAVLGFMTLNGWLERAPAARAVRAERSNTVTTPAPNTVPDGVTSSMSQERSSPAAEAVSTESPAAQTDAITPVDTGLAGTVKSRTAVVTAAQPDKRAAAARPRGPAQPGSITGKATLVTTADQANKDKVRESAAPKVDLALPPLNDEKSTGQNEVRKPESSRDADKAPSRPALPARASPTPNLR